MSGSEHKDRVFEGADDVRDEVSDSARRAYGDASTQAGDLRDDAHSMFDGAKEHAAESRRRIEPGLNDVESKAHDETGQFSDKVSDALNEAGHKFGGLIDKAKSLFGDNPKKD